MSERSNEPCWYVVHTYSGYENKVKDTLEKSVENNEAMQKLIFEVRVPVEDVVERKRDKEGNVKLSTRQRKIYPGYVLVHMINTSESWYVVRNTRGCTGFVGPDSQPIALTDEEVDKMLNPPVVDLTVSVAIGDSVIITSGPMENHQGTVVDVDNIRGKASVAMQMFGRDTTAEVDVEQLKRVE